MSCHVSIYAQKSLQVSSNVGLRGNWGRSASFDKWTKYSQNYHTFTLGYSLSLDFNLFNFFIRPNLSQYDIVHSHGVMSKTLFHFDTPRKKNIRNTNGAFETGIDFGYTLNWDKLGLTYFIGGGKIVLSRDEWDKQNNNVNMLAAGNILSETILIVEEEAFTKSTYMVNVGLGAKYAFNTKITVNADFIYQSHLRALAANSGRYIVKEIFLSSSFISFLTGSTIFQTSVGYRIF